MFNTVLTKIFVAILSTVAMFFNFFGGLADNSKAPEGALRVHYAEGINCWYNMYIPETLQSGDETDVLFVVHGGGWMLLDESEHDEQCKEAADYGFVAVTMDYSKFQNGADCEDMVNEIYTAVKSVKDTLAEKGITTDKMAITGHSAGAHLMLLYSYQHYKDSPIEIGFVLSNCAPTDFLGDAKTKKTIMGFMAEATLMGLTGEVITDFEAQAEAIAKVTPLTYITAEVPPTIVVQGNADKMVPYQNGVDLYNALKAVGNDTVFITYEGAEHFLGEEFTEGNEERSRVFFEYCEKYL